MTNAKTVANVRRWPPAALLALTLAFVWADIPWAQTAQGRVIYMATIEPRGGAQQDKEPFPTTPLPAGEGYRKTPPDANGRWEIVTYQWSPGTIVVREGETVTLAAAWAGAEASIGAKATIPTASARAAAPRRR